MTELEIKTLDLGSVLFQEEITGDDLLDSFFRGFLSDQEVLFRLSYLRMQALNRADERMRYKMSIVDELDIRSDLA